MCSRKQSVGVVGAGIISVDHVKAHRAIGQDVHAIVDVRHDAAQGLADKFAIPKALTDWRELLEDNAVDTIDICTPPQFHAEIAIAALDAGKHVICEKPLAANLAEIDSILEAEARSKSKLLVVHQLRFQPIYQRMRWLVDSGHLGKLCMARTSRYDSPPEKLVDRGVWGNWELTGGGVLMTKAIHQLDLLIWFLGPVSRVQAMMKTLSAPIESEDHVVANIEFENGAIASVEVSGAPGKTSMQLDLIGEYGRVEAPWNLRLANKSVEQRLLDEIERRFPVIASKKRASLVQKVLQKAGLRSKRKNKCENSHTPLFRSFLNSVQNDSPVAVSGQDGRNVVELVTAIYESAITGSTVELPISVSNPFYTGITKSEYCHSHSEAY